MKKVILSLVAFCIVAAMFIAFGSLGGLDKIIQRVFGDTKLEKFTVFKDALLGLFEDGGVAKALQPLQESITNLFGEDAGAAFGGITTILQSVMGVIGQLVTFSQTTVRPKALCRWNWPARSAPPSPRSPAWNTARATSASPPCASSPPPSASASTSP